MANLACVLVVLPCAEHLVRDPPVEPVVVCVAHGVVPHPHVHLLQPGGGGPAEVDGAPTCPVTVYKKKPSIP